jgi:TPR repeat protein
MQYSFRHPFAWWSLACLLGLFCAQAVAAEETPAITPTIAVEQQDSEQASDTQDKDAIEAGLAAVKRKDFAAAVAQFTPLAEAGNAEAQHNLAMLYRDGKGVKKDLATSAGWFRRAAEQGIADAQFYLGYMYDNGEGLTQSQHYAYVWYRKAAEQGLGLAQINLGVMYAAGSGVPQDLEQAYVWFHLAAVQGYKAAFDNKRLIEETLREQGWDNARLEALKKRARAAYGRYVMPFEHAPTSHLHRMQPPPSSSPPKGHPEQPVAPVAH